MSRPSSAYALVEDKRQKQFVYRFLIQAGFNRNKVTVDASPSGQGSGKQWVLGRFAQQVETCRRRNAKMSTCMFCVMDADQWTVEKCLADLDGVLKAANQQQLNPEKDPIARLIPKWSIETWILFLGGKEASNRPVMEDRPYKNSKADAQWSELIPIAAQVLYSWTRAPSSQPNNLLDSLRHGLDEIPRALPVGR